MSTFSKTFWLVVPKGGAHVNSRLAEFLGADAVEEGVSCRDGSKESPRDGWRVDDFIRLKQILRSMTSGDIEVFRCSAKSGCGVKWRSGLRRALPRRARYAKPPRRRPQAKAVH